jgi:hypothetical protein
MWCHIEGSHWQIELIRNFRMNDDLFQNRMNRGRKIAARRVASGCASTGAYPEYFAHRVQCHKCSMHIVRARVTRNVNLGCVRSDLTNYTRAFRTTWYGLVIRSISHCRNCYEIEICFPNAKCIEGSHAVDMKFRDRAPRSRRAVRRIALFRTSHCRA